MTTDEITSMKQELEDALLKCFNDFHQLTGVHVRHIGIDFIEAWQIGQRKPDRHVTGVSVELESL
jgi:hypothetical protein